MLSFKHKHFRDLTQWWIIYINWRQRALVKVQHKWKSLRMKSKIFTIKCYQFFWSFVYLFVCLFVISINVFASFLPGGASPYYFGTTNLWCMRKKGKRGAPSRNTWAVIHRFIYYKGYYFEYIGRNLVNAIILPIILPLDERLNWWNYA